METLKPPFPKNLFGQNYEISLNNLIQAVSNLPHEPKLSSLSSDFKKLLQCEVDPPFEFLWVYSALHFQGSENNDPVVAIKDLFQFIVSCSCSVSCNKFKSIALIAPVIYKLCKLVMKEKLVKEVKGVKGLVDSVIGYVTLCCEGGFDVSEGLGRSVAELIDVWMWENKGNVSDFFPLLSDQIVERKVSCEGCELSTLAGCVIAEAFLLKLSLRFSEEGSRKELQDELRAWVVASITALQNPYFFEILLLMLLEPSLPIASLLNSEDERFLRKILYDAVVLVEYSFLKPKQMDQLPVKLLKSILMSRLLVSTEAIQFHRKQKGQTKAISYTNAFTSSSLPSLIIKWIRSEIGPDDKTSEPLSSSPAALLRWILMVESSGIRIFDDNMSRIRAKSLLDSTTEGFEQLDSKDGRKKSDTDVLFFIDNKGEEDEETGGEKMNESASSAFVAAAHTMQSAEPERKTKRKGKASEEKSSVKFLKYSLLENSASHKVRSSVADRDYSSSESEVENPSSDEE